MKNEHTLPDLEAAAAAARNSSPFPLSHFHVKYFPHQPFPHFGAEGEDGREGGVYLIKHGFTATRRWRPEGTESSLEMLIG